ncbi:MAG: hypothetical protein SynsKO_33750 [Synoicihabitans sp.]
MVRPSMNPIAQPFAIVIDDEISYLQLLEAILSEILSCPIKTYTRAEAALAELPRIEVGIIVTDFYMPDMDGVQFLKKAQDIKPEVPAIIISGHKPFLDDMDTSSLRQLRSVMAKPFRIDELAREISQHWPEAMSDGAARGQA